MLDLSREALKDMTSELNYIVGSSLRWLSVAKRLHELPFNELPLLAVVAECSMEELVKSINDEANEGRTLTEEMLEHKARQQGLDSNGRTGLLVQYRRLDMGSVGVFGDNENEALSRFQKLKDNLDERARRGRAAQAIRDNQPTKAIEELNGIGSAKAEEDANRVKDFVVCQKTKGRIYAPTDMGNAELFKDLYGDSFKFVVEWRSWIVWDGARWCKDVARITERKVMEMVKKDLLSYCSTIDDDGRRTAYLKHLVNSQSASRVTATLSLAENLLSVSALVLDQNGDLLNCQNGTLDLKTFKLRPHNPKDMLTKMTNANAPTVLVQRELEDEWACVSHSDHRIVAVRHTVFR